MSSFAVCFMIRPRHHLEWQAVLLAASWRRFFSNQVNLYCYYDQCVLSDFSDRTLYALNALHVKLLPLTVAKNFNGDYPIGNKMRLSAQEFSETYVIFCDSDLLIARGFDLKLFSLGEISAATAGAATWGDPSTWEVLYERYASTPPRLWIELQSGQQSRPYHNAGLICWKNSTHFGREWLKIAELIDHDSEILDKRPWLDQIALPLAINKLNLDVCIIPAHFNKTPTSIENISDIFIFHYHGQARLYKYKLNGIASDCLKRTSSGFLNFFDLIQHALPRNGFAPPNQ